jgi:hypothetical protein
MTDYTQMSQAELQQQAQQVVNGMVPPSARGLVGTQLQTLSSEYAESLHAVIQQARQEHPNLSGTQLTQEILADLGPALQQNPQFMSTFNSLNSLAGMVGQQPVTIQQVVENSRAPLSELAPATAPAQGEAPSQTPTTPDNAPVTPQTAPTTPAASETPAEEEPVWTSYDAEDKNLVLQGTLQQTGLPSIGEQGRATLDEILTTTMVDRERYVPEALRNRDPEDPVLKLWEDTGLGEFFEWLQEKLMVMFMGKDGETYEAARHSGQAMFDAANAIRMSGPGEGVFANYESSREYVNDDGVSTRIEVRDLQQVAVFNAQIRELQDSGASRDEIRAIENQREQYVQQRFGSNVTSDEIWQEFERDKVNLTIAVLDQMGEQARANGLIDTPRGPELYEGFLGAMDGVPGNALNTDLARYNKNNIQVAAYEDGTPILDENGNTIIVGTWEGIRPERIEASREYQRDIAPIDVSALATSPSDAPSGDIAVTTTSQTPVVSSPATEQPALPTNNPCAQALNGVDIRSLNLGNLTQPTHASTEDLGAISLSIARGTVASNPLVRNSGCFSVG